ncbi:MAG: GNAT family N-acetyltransferase [Anaerolineales bacterium]|nr:GNAT family N-acetyltransferase [Anaerolineales bacterium]
MENFFSIRDMQAADYPTILELNSDSVRFLSPLTPERLSQLHGKAAYAKVMEGDGRIAAFLLGFREGAEYDSPNYLWFSARYSGFLYIDRIVVRISRRGEGMAEKFYEDLFSFAEDGGVEVIVCEVDSRPPNPVSLRFHRNRGFVEVGTLEPYGGGKQVTLFEKRLVRRERPTPARASMNKRGWFTKLLALVGTILVWLPLLLPILFTGIRLIRGGSFMLDFLMPAEFFPLVLVGGLLLCWAGWRARLRRRFLGGSLALGAVLLLGSQGLAVATGLASGKAEPEGWRLAVVIAPLIGYILAVLALGGAGMMLVRDLHARLRPPQLG